MMREIIKDGDASYFAANLQTPFYVFILPQPAGEGLSPNTQTLGTCNGRESILYVEGPRQSDFEFSPESAPPKDFKAGDLL